MTQCAWLGSVISALLAIAIGTAECATLRFDRADIDAFPDMRLFVDVLSDTGDDISGMTSPDFSVKANGSDVGEVSSQTFGDTGLGVSILLSIDASGTMKGKPLEDAKAAIASLISDLRPVDRLAILAFHDQVQIVSEFTADSDLLRKRVSEIKAEGSRTELYRSIIIGTSLLENKTLPDRRIMIVLSDGKDEGAEPSLNTFEKCIDGARSSSVPIYSVGFSRVAENSSEHLAVLKRLSLQSGGVYHYSERSEDLVQPYDAILRHLAQQYVLSFRLDSTSADSSQSIQTIVQTDEGIAESQITISTPGNENPGPFWMLVAFALGLLLLGGSLFLVLVALRKGKDSQVPDLQAPDSPRDPERSLLLGGESNESDTTKRLTCATCGRPLVDGRCLGCPTESSVLFSDTPPVNGGEGFNVSPHHVEYPVIRKTQIRSYDKCTSGTIRVENGSDSGVSVHLSTTTDLSVGRDPRNDLVLSDKSVSGHHLRVVSTPIGLQIIDLQSLNGTFLDENQIHRAHLQNESRIRLGQVVLVFSSDSQDQSNQR